MRRAESEERIGDSLVRKWRFHNLQEPQPFDACGHPFLVDSSNLPLVNDLRLVNDGVVVLSPIERIQPFDAVLSVLFAEEKRHRLPTDRFAAG